MKPVVIRNISQERLKQLFNYDDTSGLLTRIVPRHRHSNPNYSVGSIDKQGYLIVKVDGHKLLGHHVVWLYHYGVYPEKMIDHINGIRSDNRVSNLRYTTPSQNMMNSRQARSSAGYKGVSFHKEEKRYRARIMIEGKIHCLGGYSTAEEASEAYNRAAREMQGEFCCV